MNAEQKETYIAWLNDAHAMELGLIKMLEKQVNQTAQMPEMQSRIRKHLDETREHAEKIEACLERHGEVVSKTKDWISKMTTAMQGLGMRAAEDSMVKNVLTAYSAEHFEIGSYTALRCAADEFGDTETVAVCDEILEDEYRMADWVKAQIPAVTTDHIENLGAEVSEREIESEVDEKVQRPNARARRGAENEGY